MSDSVDLLTFWQKGIEDFNQGRFWHAHESWEKDWNRLPIPYRRHLQGLIQGAAVFVHLEKGRLGPAISLARLALEKLETGGIQNQILPRIEVPGIQALLVDFHSTMSVLEAEDVGVDRRTMILQYFGRAKLLRARLAR